MYILQPFSPDDIITAVYNLPNVSHKTAMEEHYHLHSMEQI